MDTKASVRADRTKANATAPGEEDQRGRPEARWVRWVGALSPKRLSAVYLGIFFVVLFGILNPDTFLTTSTLRLVLSEGVVTSLVALAFLVPLAAGVFDLSVGSMLAFSLGISVYLQNETGISPPLGAAIALCACALVGTLAGFIVVRLHVNSFIATLGTSQLMFAAVLLLSNNRQLIGEYPDYWSTLGNGQVFGIPYVMIYLLVIALILWYVLEQTRVGRYLFATGGNREASRLAGVATERIVWGSLVVSALIAGLAGIVYAMRIPVFSASIGIGYLFPAVAAVFLGASQLSQRPNVWGTLIAYFALAFGIHGLALAASGTTVWSRPLFEGVALIVAVALASRPAVRKLRAATEETHTRDE